MIPVRVSIRNFLCYGEADDGGPIEFDFEGASLWSISGDNGAGKSAIFDAITYALFGRHRGGGQRDSRLIHRDAVECEAAFDFRLDGQCYRVRRTVGRPRGRVPQEPKTWQATWLNPENGAWLAIPETERDAGLARWVREKLGFGYETFVASVLLLQGQSDQLILAEPKKRFEILSGLLDLELYERLEKKAGERAGMARVQVRQLETQLSALPRITDVHIAEARETLQLCEQALEHARAVATKAEVFVTEARRYEGLGRALLETQASMSKIQGLLQDAERIVRDYGEWCRLSGAVPKLVSALRELVDADRHRAGGEQVRARYTAIDVAKLERLAAEAEAAERQAEANLRELRRQHRELGEAAPALRELLHRRRELEVREREVVTIGEPQVWNARVSELEAALRTRQEQGEAAEAALRRAVEARARQDERLNEASAQAKARAQAQDEAVCSRCGQRVDRQHIERELHEAKQAVASARDSAAEAMRTLKAAERQALNAVSGLRQAQAEMQETRRKLEAALRADAERNRAKSDLETAVAATEHAPAHLRSAIKDKPIDQAGASLVEFETQLGHLGSEVGRAEQDGARAGQRRQEATRAHQQAVQERQRLEAEAVKFESEAAALERQATVRLEEFEPEWRERVLTRDDGFAQALTARLRALDGIAERHAELQRAAAERDRLAADTRRLEQELAAVLLEYRAPLQQAEQNRSDSHARLKITQQRRDIALDEMRAFETAREQRGRVEQELRDAQRQWTLYTRLEKLLGRGGLQAFLMDEAVGGISDLANETLARISGGQLQVRVERQASVRREQEIAIQAMDLASSEESLDVQFVSGSQRFRISVALAAAIGQYAGRGAGSVRSLIIDEGFGSLDTHGRQEMIDELRNLTQCVDRIIVVSHQEDFQDRTLFPTGYILRKVGQQTEVERCV